MRKRQKDYKSQKVIGDSRKTGSSRHSQTGEYRNSQGLGQNSKELHGFKPDRVAALKLGDGHRLPTLTKKLSILLEKKKIHFLQWSLTGYIKSKPHLQEQFSSKE